MRILFDSSPTLFSGGGTRTYIEQLMAALGRIAGDEGVELQVAATPAWLRQQTGKGLRHKLRVLGWDSYYMHLALPRQAARAALLHTPAVRGPLYTPVPEVATIYDVTSELFPQFFRPHERLVLGAYLRRCRHAARVLTISEQSRRDITRTLGIPAKRVTVTYLAAAPIFRPLPPDAAAAVAARYGVRGPYILSVCTIEPRKNLIGVLEAFASLRRERAIPHKMVFSGQRGWLDAGFFRRLEELGVADDVVFTGYVPADDLPALYGGADLFAYVPFYEGFGLPPLEAMSCGAPVLTASTSSLPEVVGDAAVMVAPSDTVAIAAAMGRILSTPALAADLRERGLARARHFSWERCARETVAVYRQVLATA